MVKKRTWIDDSSDSSGSDTGDGRSSSRQDKCRCHHLSQSDDNNAEGLDISASMSKHSLLEVSWLNNYMR